MADGVMMVDQQGVIVDCNPVFHQRLGYEKSEIVGMSVKTLDPPEYANRVPERLEEIASQGQATFETAHTHKDGTIMPVELNARLLDVEGDTYFFSIVRDITKRKQREAKHQARLEIYDAAINTPALGFWVVDNQGKFLEVNDTYVTQSGYSRDELLNMRIPDIEAMEKPEDTAAHMEELLRVGFGRFRSAHRRKDGTIWPVEVVTTISQLQGGLFIVFVENIEDKVAQESRLKQAVRVYDVMDQAVVVTDADNKIVSINPAMTNISGYTIDDLKGRDPKIFASGEHDKAFYADMWKALEASGHWTGEIMDRRKNGEIYTKQLTINVIKDVHGAVSQYVSVFSDISVRKRAEVELKSAHEELEQRVKVRTKELKESGVRYKEIVEGSDDLITVVDGNGKFTFANNMARYIYGIEPEDCVGRLAFDFVYSDDRASTLKAFQSWVKDKKTSAAFENRQQSLDGTVRTMLWTVNIHYHPTGKVENVTSIARDISARKEAENQAIAANRTKSDLLANMSHELRTPLNAIIGFSDTIKAEVFGPLGNDKYNEYIDDINYSGKHLLDLINDILDVSAIEAGAIKLNEENISIPETVNSSIRIIQQRADEGKVTVSSSISSDFPQIKADKRRIKQVMLNLLSNAVKFTPESGEVSVNSWTNDDGSLVVAVSDTGMGMDENEIETALSAFGQVDSGLDRKHEGTGLGLPLTKGLIELHGGTLALKSEKGRGTQVTVTFPKEREAKNVS